jgi:hypothetical protein
MSIVTTAEKTIGGTKYRTRILPATSGLVILPKVVALMGEPIIKLMTEDEDMRAKMVENPAILAAILASMAKQAAKDDGLLVVVELMEGVQADKVRIGDAEVDGSVAEHFDTHFAGRYKHLAEVAMWVMTVNFAAP